MASTSNPSTQGFQVGKSQDGGNPGLHRKNLTPKTQKQTKKVTQKLFTRKMQISAERHPPIRTVKFKRLTTLKRMWVTGTFEILQGYQHRTSLAVFCGVLKQVATSMLLNTTARYNIFRENFIQYYSY